MIVRSKQPFELTGRHVLLMLVAFFVIVFGVQAIFITTAVYTHTGLVSQQPYRKGLNYGERIAFAERQEKLGWHESVQVRDDGRLAVTIKDEYGKPVRGLQLEAAVSRAVTDAEDVTLTFDAGTDGVYVASLSDGMAGTYVADIVASKEGGDVVWRMRKRLWLQP